MEKRVKAWVRAIDYIMGVRIHYLDVFLKNHRTKDFAVGLWLHDWPYHFNENDCSRTYVLPEICCSEVREVLEQLSTQYQHVRFGSLQRGVKLRKQGHVFNASWETDPRFESMRNLVSSVMISERMLIKEGRYDKEVKQVLLSLSNDLLNYDCYDTTSTLITRWGALVLLERYLIENGKVRNRRWLVDHHVLEHAVLARVCLCVVTKLLFDSENTYYLSAYAEEFASSPEAKEKKISYLEAYNWMKSVEVTVLLRCGWDVLPFIK